MSSTSDLGKVSIVPKGEYSSIVQYERLDIVGSNGSAFIALKNSIGHPVSDPIYWYELVHAGNGITEITGPVSSGLIDTYTIHFTDGTTTSFSVDNGRGIQRINPPATPGVHGQTDTYTIIYNDGTTSTFVVSNGDDGEDGGILSVDGISAASGQRNVELMMIGHGAPTTSTSAAYKQRYLDADSGVLYVCLTQSGSTYNWIPVGTSAKVENETLKFTV